MKEGISLCAIGKKAIVTTTEMEYYVDGHIMLNETVHNEISMRYIRIYDTRSVDLLAGCGR